MAISLSSITSAVLGDTLFTTLNVTKVVPSQSTNTFVFVVINCNKSGSFVYEDPTSVTYDSVAMTKLMSETNTQSGIGIWYIQNAAVGAGDIEATWANNMLYARMNAFYATGAHATSSLANDLTTTMTTQMNGTTATLTPTNTWTNSKIMGFDVSYVLNRTYDMDFGGTETSFYAYSTTNQPDTGRVTKEQGSYKTSSGGSVSLTRTMNNISDTGNDVYLSFLAFELRSADGSAILDLSSNMKMTSNASIRIDRSFLSNLVLTPIFSTSLTYAKVFLENVKMTPIFLRDIFITFLENIKLTSSISKLVSKTFSETVKMTSSLVKIFISHFFNFTENIVISSFSRIIKDGIRVGIWSKAAKATATFTKTAKKVATWNKEQKEI